MVLSAVPPPEAKIPALQGHQAKPLTAAMCWLQFKMINRNISKKLTNTNKNHTWTNIKVLFVNVFRRSRKPKCLKGYRFLRKPNIYHRETISIHIPKIIRTIIDFSLTNISFQVKIIHFLCMGVQCWYYMFSFSHIMMNDCTRSTSGR